MAPYVVYVCLSVRWRKSGELPATDRRKREKERLWNIDRLLRQFDHYKPFAIPDWHSPQCENTFVPWINPELYIPVLLLAALQTNVLTSYETVSNFMR